MVLGRNVIAENYKCNSTICILSFFSCFYAPDLNMTISTIKTQSFQFQTKFKNDVAILQMSLLDLKVTSILTVWCVICNLLKHGCFLLIKLLYFCCPFFISGCANITIFEDTKLLHINNFLKFFVSSWERVSPSYSSTMRWHFFWGWSDVAKMLSWENSWQIFSLGIMVLLYCLSWWF